MSRIAEIIKYEGDNSTFIWKHPCEDFNSLTQLIVHESQEAIFFMNGEALDLFGPGRHTLETQNIPMLGKLLNGITGGETPFHAEVYFINKTVQMAVKWGTDSRVRFIDPNFGVPLEIGASGEMNLMVSDPRKLLVKLVGTMSGISWEERGEGFTKSLCASFRPLISTAVKTNLSGCIKAHGINILEIDENLELLSKVLKQSILPGFEEYGLTVPEFYVTNVVLPENDPNFKKIRDLYAVSLQKKMIEAETEIGTAKAHSKAAVTAAEREAVLEGETTETEVARRQAERDIIRAQAEAQAKKISGFAEAEVMREKGYTEKDVMHADVQKAFAEGLGNMTITGGSVAGDMIGLGVGIAAAGAVNGQVGEMLKGFGVGSDTDSSQPQSSKVVCAKCGAEVPENSKFCLECGEKITPAVPDNMVVCPECGNTVVKGKFCPECGHKFVTSCPKCGNAIVPGAKFCPECGEKL